MKCPHDRMENSETSPLICLNCDADANKNLEEITIKRKIRQDKKDNKMVEEWIKSNSKKSELSSLRQ